MAEIKCFVDGRVAVEGFLDKEYPSMSAEMRAQLIDFIPNLNRYHEEGMKLRPTILFCSDIAKCAKAVKDAYSLLVFEEADETTFRLKMKALASFSRHGWHIYVERKPDCVRYGLIKALNSLKDKDYEQLLFESNLANSENQVLFVKGLGGTAISIKSIDGEQIVVDFSLTGKQQVDDWEVSLENFVSDAFSKLHTTKNKLADVKTLFKNVFQKANRSIDGALCVIVDKDYKDNGFFEDGVWFKNPIEFSKLFLKSASFSESKLLDVSNLFIDMLNYDGITIIDNIGRVRAYNVFVESTSYHQPNVLGGARKRAAYTIINTKRSKIMGVYFQSHDGESFYSRAKGYRTRAKRKATNRPIEKVVEQATITEEVEN